MEEEIQELKEKFEGSNKYMLTLNYEDIKELFAIIEVLKNKEPAFLIKDLYDHKLKEIKLQDVKGLIEEGREEVKQKIKAKIDYLLKRYDSEEDFCSYDVLISILKSLLKEG